MEQSSWETVVLCWSKNSCHIMEPVFKGGHTIIIWSQVNAVHIHPSSWFNIHINVLQSCLSLPGGLFPWPFATKTLYAFLFSTTCYLSQPSHPWVNQPNYVRSVSCGFLVASVFSSRLLLSPSLVQIFFTTPSSLTSSVYLLPLIWETKNLKFCVWLHLMMLYQLKIAGWL